MADKHQFFTPVGRFVSGSLTEKRDKDNQNRPIEPDKQRYEFGMAIAKSDPNVGALIQGLAAYAYAEYGKTAPHVAQRVANWMQTLDGFSMKFSNGDAPNTRGQVNQNTVGHWVFWFSTSIDIVGAVAPSNQQYPLDKIKRGYFIDVAGTAMVNGLTDNNAGIYLNPTCVRLVAEGDEILGGVDPTTLFAQHQVGALPPGARPIGSAPGLPAGAGMPGAGLPGVGGATGFGMPPATQQPAGMPPAAQGGMQPFGAAGGLPGVGQTASPGNGFPAHPGILGGVTG